MTRQPRDGRTKTTRVPVRLPEETASGQWLRSIRLSGFAITALVLIVLFVVVLAPSLRVLVEQQQQISALHESVKDAKKSVSELKAQKARWDDPGYVEALARERLDYVFPGDYSYLVIDDGSTTATTNGQPISDKIQTTRVDWVSSLLSSVFTAGLTDQQPDQIVAPVIKQK
ncbi:MAG TPA: septum formation initiator family protein [Lacisediminihabitans sp.]|uniref:FtsB family cell division protein n=1 Tax=Lacisediminihabitans sp. TaxID=2787631 RepID=UPI002ED89FDC